jgi:hypothetical protein
MEIFGDDGYPTEEFLQSIAEWDYKKGFNDLLEHAMQGHIYGNYWNREPEKDGKTEWHVSTGGWSGNESIIAALKDNQMFWMMCWVQSRRGGHYIFECRT